MVELLIVATCIHGTGPSCTQLAEFYYKDRKIDVMVENFRRKHKTADAIGAQVLSIGTVLVNRQLSIAVYSGVTATAGETSGSLQFRRDF